MFLLDDVQYVIGVFKSNFGTLFKPDFFRDRSIKILSFSALQGKDTYTSAYVMYVKIDQCHITSLGHATNPSGGRPSLAPFSTEIGSAVGRWSWLVPQPALFCNRVSLQETGGRGIKSIAFLWHCKGRKWMLPSLFRSFFASTSKEITEILNQKWWKCKGMTALSFPFRKSTTTKNKATNVKILCFFFDKYLML